MKKGSCPIHGVYFESFLQAGCPQCREAEEQAETGRAKIQEEISRLNDSLQASREAGESEREASEARILSALYAVNNPGDYQCPSCKLRTLLMDAERCPRCQKDVKHGYWDDIRERERRRAEEQKRERIEREARELVAAKAQAEQEKGENTNYAMLAILFAAFCIWACLVCWQVVCPGLVDWALSLPSPYDCPKGVIDSLLWCGGNILIAIGKFILVAAGFLLFKLPLLPAISIWLVFESVKKAVKN